MNTHAWPSDLGLETHGAWRFAVHGGIYWKACMQSCYEKKYQIFGWTWESNPGPNDNQPDHQPLSHAPAFVSMIMSKYNIKNMTIMLETKSRALLFKRSNHKPTRSHLPRLPVKRIDSGGF